MEQPTQIDSLVKTDTGAFLNKSALGLAAYKKMKEEKRKIKTLEDTVEMLLDRVSRLESLINTR